MSAGAGRGAGQDCFGQAALCLLGMMARLCGWRPDEFWRATPADVAAVLAGMSGGGDGADGVGVGFGAVDSGQMAAMMERFPDG